MIYGTFSGELPPPRTPRPCAPRSTAYCLKLTYLTAAICSSMAPKSVNFARKNRIATIPCVHHHFPDFRKPSRNIVQIGAEFERKMADIFRKNLDISVHKMVVQLLSVEQRSILQVARPQAAAPAASLSRRKSFNGGRPFNGCSPCNQGYI